MKKNTEFKVGEYCVYKTHGVAKIKEIQTIELKDFKSKCLVLYFEKEKLTITVPESQIENMEIRKISTKSDMEEVFTILSNGVKKIKGMWSRRAKEYESTISYLINNQLVYRSYKIKDVKSPLSSCKDKDSFKLYLPDDGLLFSMLHLNYKQLISNESIKETLYENHIAKTLVESGYVLYY